jgi:mRNA-degrading endonuclease RelE of RelBE toxin-antitoxin system
MMDVRIERGGIKTLEKFPDKIQEHIFNLFRKLENPFTAPDVECLHSIQQIYRLNIGRTYTVIFDLMTIEHAHKRYGRYS